MSYSAVRIHLQQSGNMLCICTHCDLMLVIYNVEGGGLSRNSVVRVHITGLPGMTSFVYRGYHYENMPMQYTGIFFHR